jgi:UDP-N-acetyl-D-mannosaminuronate dehydrogenase
LEQEGDFVSSPRASIERSGIGLGYVGLPLALLFSRNGLRTTGFDSDLFKTEKLERGETYIEHMYMHESPSLTSTRAVF